MNEQIRLLQAEIRENLDAIADTYTRLQTISHREIDEETAILLAYHLHVIYGLFENMFTRIAANFGNHVEDSAQWHALLLKRMTLDIPEVRPRVIQEETFLCLDELRRFRHLFRNAYLLRFDPQRLQLLLQDAWKLQETYPQDLNSFLQFLESLLSA